MFKMRKTASLLLAVAFLLSMMPTVTVWAVADAAPGGTINASTTTVAQVAAMFGGTDGSAGDTVVGVTLGSGAFTVTLKSDITLMAPLVISGRAVTIISNGSARTIQAHGDFDASGCEALICVDGGLIWLENVNITDPGSDVISLYADNESDMLIYDDCTIGTVFFDGSDAEIDGENLSIGTLNLHGGYVGFYAGEIDTLNVDDGEASISGDASNGGDAVVNTLNVDDGEVVIDCDSTVDYLNIADEVEVVASFGDGDYGNTVINNIRYGGSDAVILIYEETVAPDDEINITFAPGYTPTVGKVLFSAPGDNYAEETPEDFLDMLMLPTGAEAEIVSAGGGENIVLKTAPQGAYNVGTPEALTSAINAIGEGAGTIVLTGDVEITASIVITQGNITIDGGNHTIKVTDGTFSNTDNYGMLQLNGSGASLTLKDVTLNANEKARVVYDRNGAMYTSGSVTFTKGNTSGDGGGCIVCAGSSLTVLDGTLSITGNTAGTFAGGLRQNGNYGNITIKSGATLSVTNNVAPHTTPTGTEKYLVGGMFVESYGGSAFVIENNGKLVVTGNTLTDGTVSNTAFGNFSSPKGYFTLKGALASGSSIGVSNLGAPVTGLYTQHDGKIAKSDGSYTITTADKSFFTPDMGGTIALDGTGTDAAVLFTPGTAPEAVYVSGTGDDSTGDGTAAHPYATIGKAFEKVSDGGAIRVLSDLTMPSATTEFDGKEVTIASYSGEDTPKTDGAWTLTASSGNNMLEIASSGEVTLENITLNGNNQVRVVAVGGTLKMNTGATITNGSAANGGVYVSGGTFDMTSGTITGNKASYGGGVYVNSGTFNMTGGTITGNKANYGGGVYVAGGAFNIGSNAAVVITGNTAGGATGNVYLASGSTIALTNGNLAAGSAIGVSVQVPPAAGDTVQVATNATAAAALNFFTSDKAIPYVSLMHNGGTVIQFANSQPRPVYGRTQALIQEVTNTHVDVIVHVTGMPKTGAGDPADTVFSIAPTSIEEAPANNYKISTNGSYYAVYRFAATANTQALSITPKTEHYDAPTINITLPKKVTSAANGYQGDGSSMQYKKDASTGRIQMFGNNGGLKTTYANYGWKPDFFRTGNLESWYTANPVPGTDFVEISFYLYNPTGAAISNAAVSLYADIMIGSNDRAPITPYTYSNGQVLGFQMKESTASDAATLTLINMNKDRYVSESAPNQWTSYSVGGHTGGALLDSAVESTGDLSGVDSVAVARVRNITVPAGEMYKYSIYIGAGGLTSITTQITTSIMPTAVIGNNKYNSLQDAINAANPGDTITLMKNSNEIVTVTSSITLEKGANANQIGGFLVYGDVNLTVKGLTLTKSGDNIYLYNGAQVTLDSAVSGAQAYIDGPGSRVNTAAAVTLRAGVNVPLGQVLATGTGTATLSNSGYALKTSGGNKIYAKSVVMSFTGGTPGTKTYTVTGTETFGALPAADSGKVWVRSGTTVKLNSTDLVPAANATFVMMATKEAYPIKVTVETDYNGVVAGTYYFASPAVLANKAMYKDDTAYNNNGPMLSDVLTAARNGGTGGLTLDLTGDITAVDLQALLDETSPLTINGPGTIVCGTDGTGTLAVEIGQNLTLNGVDVHGNINVAGSGELTVIGGSNVSGNINNSGTTALESGTAGSLTNSNDMTMDGGDFTVNGTVTLVDGNPLTLTSEIEAPGRLGLTLDGDWTADAAIVDSAGAEDSYGSVYITNADAAVNLNDDDLTVSSAINGGGNGGTPIVAMIQGADGKAYEFTSFTDAVAGLDLSNESPEIIYLVDDCNIPAGTSVPNCNIQSAVRSADGGIGQKGSNPVQVIIGSGSTVFTTTADGAAKLNYAAVIDAYVAGLALDPSVFSADNWTDIQNAINNAKTNCANATSYNTIGGVIGTLGTAMDSIPALPSVVYTASVDSEGYALVTIATEPGVLYSLVNRNGNAVVAPSSGGTAADGTAAAGWYEADASGMMVFSGLDVGGQYAIVSVDTSKNDPFPHIASTTPAAYVSNGSKIDAAIPAVGGNVYAPDKNTIVIDPAANVDGYVYVLTNAVGEVLAVGDIDNGAVTFDGLTANTGYQIALVPDTTDVGDNVSGNGSLAPVKTPNASFAAPTEGQITRESGTAAGTDKITVTGAVAGQEYGLLNGKTGEIQWVTANGGSVAFDNIDPSVTYGVVTRTPNADAPSLTSKPVMVAPLVTTGVDANGDGTVTLTASNDYKYAVVDADGDLIHGVVAYDADGDAIDADSNGWFAGDGDIITFKPLPAGGEYTVIRELKTADPATDLIQDGADAGLLSGGVTVNVPAVGDNLTAGVDENGDAFIVINPTVSGKFYAVVKADGSATWLEADGGELVFGNLAPGESYSIIVSDAEGSINVNLDNYPNAVTVNVPAVGENLTAGVDEDGDAYIAINPAVNGKYYAVVDGNGNAIWQLATGGEVVFEGLAVGGTYSVIVSDTLGDDDVILADYPNAVAVNVPAMGDNLCVGVDKDGDAFIVINPAVDGKFYAVVKADGNATWLQAVDGEVVFEGLAPGESYSIIVSDAAGSNNVNLADYPNAVAVNVPAVGDNLTAGVDENGDAYIVINPAVDGKFYAVVDAEGNATWVETEDGKVFFGELVPGESYSIIMGDDDSDSTPDLNEYLDAVTVTAPPAAVNASQIVRKADAFNEGKEAITISGIETGYEYAVVLKGTLLREIGEDEWQTGASGSSLTFDNLDPTRDYEVLVRKVIADGSTALPSVTESNHFGGKLALTGTVTDAGGMPVGAGVVVKVAVNTPSGPKTLSAKTDNQGWFNITAEPVLAGEYILYVDGGNGNGTYSGAFVVGNQPQTANISLADNGNASGFGGIVTKNGAPVTGGTVTVKDIEGTTVTTTANLSDAGGYTISGLADGRYTVSVTGTDGTSAMAEIVINDGVLAKTTVNLTMSAGAIVTGHITGLDEDEKVKVSIAVPVYGENGTDIIGVKTLTATATGENGYYQFAPVPNGSYILTATDSNGNAGKTLITVSGGAITVPVAGAVSKDIINTNEDETMTALSGILLNADGKPVSGAAVTLYKADGTPVTPAVTATTGSGGGYTLLLPDDGDALTDGMYYVSAVSGGSNALAGPIQIGTADGKRTVSGKTNITVSGDAGELLVGRAINANGNAASGATVAVKDAEGAVIATGVTDKDGYYFIPNVPSAADAVTITAKNGEANTSEIITNDDGNLTTENNPLQTIVPGSNVLTVIGPDSAILPLTNEDATATEAAVSISPAGSISVTATGALDVSVLANGTYAVTVAKDGMSATKSITVRNGAITGTGNNVFTITTAAVTGKVNYASGPVPSGATVTVSDADSGKQWGTAVMKADGTYSIPGIPAGTYTETITLKDDTGFEIAVITNTITVGAKGVTLREFTNTTDNEAEIVDKNVVVGPSVAAQVAIDALTTVKNDTTPFIQDIKDALSGYKALSAEERRQISNDLVASVTAKLISAYIAQRENADKGEFAVNAGVQGDIDNVTDVAAALENQKALLLSDGDLSKADSDERSVTVDLTLIAQEVTEDPHSGDMNKLEALATVREAEVGAVFDISIVKTTTVTGDDSEVVSTELVEDVPQMIEITLAIPGTLSDDYAYFAVAMVHKGATKILPCIVKSGKITFNTRQFSSYALLVSNEPIFDGAADADKEDEDDDDDNNGGTPGGNPGGTPGGNVGGGTGGGTAIAPSANGAVTISPESPKAGDTVTITVTPDKGYVLDTLSIIDENGKTVEYTDNGDGTFTYIQPGSAVTITAAFTPAVAVSPAKNGTVTMNPALPVEGDTVTITVTPDKGYVLEALNITDRDGKAVAFTDNGDGTYSYIQPAGAVTITAVFAAKPKDDSDVSHLLITEDHMAYLKGRGNNLFAPQEDMTRAEVAQMLFNLLRNKNVAATVTFNDVTEGEWYAEAVHTLAALGIINGYEDGSFQPGKKIKRSEFAAMVTRFAAMKASDVQFDDVPTGHWAYQYINTAAGFGWIQGKGDNRFDPDSNIKRSEAATLVNRMLGRKADEVYIDANADNLVIFTDVGKEHWAYYDIMEAANAHDHEMNGTEETWK